MGKYSAVVFDLDGTLVDSSPDIAAALNRVLAEYGGRELRPEEVVPLLGEGSRRLVEEAALLSGAAIGAALTTVNKAYLDEYRAQPAELSTVYPGVAEALESLRSEGIPMGVCTNKNQELAEIVLRELDLADCFSAIVGADVVAESKPAPGHLLAAVKGLAAEPSETLYVGDSVIDEATAAAARVEFVATSWAPDTVTARRFDYADLAEIVLSEKTPQMTPPPLTAANPNTTAKGI